MLFLRLEKLERLADGVLRCKFSLDRRHMGLSAGHRSIEGCGARIKKARSFSALKMGLTNLLVFVRVKQNLLAIVQKMHT